MKPQLLLALLAPVALYSPLARAAEPTEAPATPPLKGTPPPGAKAKGETAGATNAAATDAGHGMPGHVHGEDEAEEAGGEPFGPNETNSEYFWRRSDKAFHDGDYEHAILIHRGIVALDPTDTESYGVAAWLLWSLGKGDEATAHLRRGLAANPQDPEMWDQAGQQYDLQKKLPEAKDAYQNAVKFSPAGTNTMMLRRRLAHAAEKAGDVTLSVQTWRDLVRDFPNDPVNKNNLARVEKLPAKISSNGLSATPEEWTKMQIVPSEKVKYYRVSPNIGF